MLLVNLKAYRKGTGDSLDKVVGELEEAAESTGKRIIVSPQPQEMYRTQSDQIETFSQHIDPVEPGSHTGSILAESAAELASGTILNHSENRMPHEELVAAIEKASENGLETVVCAQDPEECREVSKLDPDFVAFEPPELIGGDTAVSEAEPELIEEAVNKSEKPVLTGAGIKSREDVEKSVKLGCHGVLVASGVVKAESIREEAEELCRGL